MHSCKEAFQKIMNVIYIYCRQREVFGKRNIRLPKKVRRADSKSKRDNHLVLTIKKCIKFLDKREAFK